MIKNLDGYLKKLLNRLNDSGVFFLIKYFNFFFYFQNSVRSTFFLLYPIFGFSSRHININPIVFLYSKFKLIYNYKYVIIRIKSNIIMTFDCFFIFVYLFFIFLKKIYYK